MIRIKLKAVLAEKGIKQKDLVAMTGIRQPTLSGMNNNSVKHIPLDVLDKLCTVLDCQPADLLEFVPDENEKSPDASSVRAGEVISCETCSRSEGCAAPL